RFRSGSAIKVRATTKGIDMKIDSSDFRVPAGKKVKLKSAYREWIVALCKRAARRGEYSAAMESA
ncbi:MAG TPA: hypothetical protein VMV87_06710, partial [Burkholderiales bacterium]|nr:hypothetical protein [Burkholderiales bacterium]